MVRPTRKLEQESGILESESSIRLTIGSTVPPFWVLPGWHFAHSDRNGPVGLVNAVNGSLRTVTNRGGSRNLGKGESGKGAKPQTKRRRRERWRGASQKNFEKLDAISCNLAYIFGIRMASDIIQNWAFAKQKKQ